ncbi:peptide deformylase [Gorillibacterium timonense]|uniref:peptide deformylase n=1 Tax=Gorillibacterium timonense TaxID=1689269 RepID=UPI00071CB1D4|nr:peptide deformylase [Gorillibacterium timonense]
MTTRPILPFGDPILRKTARPVTEWNDRLSRLLDDLGETLYAAEGRAGLAAPQIGILRRVIVMDCGDGLIELVNPVIIERSGEQYGTEGCLSYPGYYGKVKRSEQVKLTTMDRSGALRELEASGYLARCIQHEIDHLDGILYIDHIQNGELYFNQTDQPASLYDIQRRTRKN